MKITALPALGVPSVSAQGVQSPARVDSVAVMKMNTNATPLSNQQELPISAISEAPAQPVVEATQPLSPQLALLAKQRRALQVKERELAEREKALQPQGAQAAGVDLARLKSEPLSVLLEAGVTYEQLTEAILANQSDSKVTALEKKIEDLKLGIDKEFADREAASEKQVYAEMKREAQSLLRGDEFELVRETRSLPHVMDLIERTYRKSGEVLDVTEALGLIENELFKDAQRIQRLKKMQIKEIQQAVAQQPQRPQGMRTLTNRDTASVPLSAKQRAMAAFYGTLKR